MNRSTRHVIRARKVRMGEIYLDQPLPHPLLNDHDPFLLIHHWSQTYEGGLKQKQIGVGPHPHRGFTPVTLIFKGALHHRDSLGNNSIVSAGGTQWTRAGKGITHSERPSKEIAEAGGELELIQFWLNTPKAFKMKAPAYFSLTEDETPAVHTDADGVDVRLVAGNYEGSSSPIPTDNDVLILRFSMESNASLTLKVPKDFNALIYQLDGSFEVGDSETRPKDMIVYENDGDTIELNARDATRGILLAGKPLNEPVVAQGPFVMNQEIEIMEAMRDYQMGKMGVLIEEFE